MKLIDLKNSLLRLFCVAISMLALYACIGGSSDPVAVAEQFAKAYCDADFDKCNKLMDKDAKNRFVPSSERSEAEKQMFKMMQEHTKKMKYKLTLNKEETEISEESTTAIFDVTSSTESSFSEKFVIGLIKDDKTDKWLVYKYKVAL